MPERTCHGLPGVGALIRKPKCAKLNSTPFREFIGCVSERRERAILSGLGGTDGIGYLAVLFILGLVNTESPAN